MSWDEVRQRFDAEKWYWLATTGRDRRPHVRPVLAAWLADKIYSATSPGARKGHDLKHRPECSLAPHAPAIDIVIEGPPRGRWPGLLEQIAAAYDRRVWLACDHHHRWLCSTVGDMPARKRPTPEDTVTARRALLDGLARDADIFELVSELAPLHPRNNTFPGEVFLHVAADALKWCGASQADPLPLEGLRERFLPESTSRGRQNKKLQYAVLAAAAVHGGTEPDLLDEVAWWQTDDFWQYALFAAVAYIRAAASRAGVPVRQACQDLAQRRDHPAP